MWLEGEAIAVDLPAGQTLGRAEDINNLYRIVGSVGGGSSQYAAVFGDSAYVVETTTETGCYGNVLFAINDLGLAAGTGLDPGNAARNVGFVYDTETDTAWEVGALEGLDGALCFGISNGGHVVGSSMLSQGSGLPFVWTAADGIQPVPLPAGTSQGGARGANVEGWVVGIASSAYAIPFLYDGETTYRVHDLLPAASGWDLATNTFSSAMDISDEGIIVGTGVHEGEIRAYALIPDDIVAVLVQHFTAIGRDDGIELRWSLGVVADRLPVTLERGGTVDGPWQPVTAPVATSGFDRVVLDTDTVPGGRYGYRLSTADAGGERITLAVIAGERPAAPTDRPAVALRGAAPNPFNPRTSVSFRLDRPLEVRLEVLDARGRRVAVLAAGSFGAGEHAVVWDGRDLAGRQLPSGSYVAVLEAPGHRESVRLTLVR
jgi:hypothetical protein